MAHRIKGLGSGIRFRATRSGLFANAPSIDWTPTLETGSLSPPTPITESFDPLAITSSEGSGAVLWLRSDDIIQDGTKVARWNDKSVKGQHFTASTSAAQAVYFTSSIFSSKPLVEFNGANHSYKSVTAMPLTATSRITVFAFADVRGVALPFTGGTIFDSTPATSTPYNGVNLGINVNNNGVTKKGFVMTSQVSQTAPAEHAFGDLDSELPPNTPHSGVILIGKYDHQRSGGSKLQLTANYTPVSLTYPGTDGVSLGNYGNMTASLGGRQAGAITAFSGGLLELIVYDFELSTDQTVAVTNYLSGRYYGP